MFCPFCGKERCIATSQYCEHCGKGVQSSSSSAISTTICDLQKEKNQGKALSFEDFKKSKSQSWFTKVHPKAAKKEFDVGVNIGVLTWHDKSGKIKPLRGKRVLLRVSPDATPDELRGKAVKRYIDFFPGILEEEESNYNLTYENGDLITTIPGSTEQFTLKKYKEEIGKDFKSITLYILSNSDKLVLEKQFSNPFDHENLSYPDNGGTTEPEHNVFDTVDPPVVQNLDNENLSYPDNGGTTEPEHNVFDTVDPPVVQNLDNELVENPSKKVKCDYQEVIDEIFARSLQETFMDVIPSAFQDEPAISLPELLAKLQVSVIKDKQFYIVSRRGSSLDRRLSLWKREASKTDVHSQLMVHFTGESGIDAGAMYKEFLTDVLKDIRKTMFPNGGPRDSMLDIQNSNFYTCGQISAVSIVQGGPPPLVLHPSLFDLMLKGTEFELRNITMDQFIPSDASVFERIRANPVDESDLIIENGYTGAINNENIDIIIKTVMIGIASRRLNYLAEYMRGLETFTIATHLFSHRNLLEKLFVFSPDIKPVDANYVYSLMKPIFSSEQTSKRVMEEHVMDHIQDFLMLLEDTQVSGPSEALAYDDDDVTEIEADLTPSGVMKWLTGQSHKPLNEEDVDITIYFNHDCMTMNPGHSICFPVVHACSRELTLPILHMKSFDDFKNNFKLAFCKGQSFGVQ